MKALAKLCHNNNNNKIDRKKERAKNKPLLRAPKSETQRRGQPSSRCPQPFPNRHLFCLKTYDQKFHEKWEKSETTNFELNLGLKKQYMRTKMELRGQSNRIKIKKNHPEQQQKFKIRVQFSNIYDNFI